MIGSNIKNYKRISSSQYEITLFQWKNLPLHAKKLVASKSVIKLLQYENVSLKKYVYKCQSYREAIQREVDHIDLLDDIAGVRVLVTQTGDKYWADGLNRSWARKYRTAKHGIKITEKIATSSEHFKCGLNEWLKPAIGL